MSAGRAFSGLSRDADTAAAALRKAETHMGGSFGRISRHAEVMHAGVTKSFGLMKSVFTGFIGGMAAQKLSGWGLGGHAADAETRRDYLRIYGAKEPELKAYDKHVKELRRLIPGVDKSDYFDAMFQIRSLMGDNAATNKKAAEALLDLGKLMSPTGTMTGAIEYARAMMAAYGVGKGAGEKQQILEKIMAQTKVALQEKLVMGHDLQMAARQLAPLYSAGGRSTADLLSDLATAGEVAAERAGELVRNLFTKQGEGYSKVAAALAKERLLAAKGFKYEFQVPADKRSGLSTIVKAYEEYTSRHAARLLASGNIQQYNKELKRLIDNLLALGKLRGLDTAKVVNEAFGETASQVLPHLLRAWTEGGQGEFKTRLEQVIPSEQSRKIRESFQSLAAQSKIFDQQLGNLGGSFRKLFSPAISAVLKHWGTSIDDITDAMDRLLEGSDTSMKRFIAGFETGFGSAFGGGDLGIAKWMKQMIDALNLGEEGWAKLGADIGGVLGNIAAGLRDVGSTAAAVAESINAIAAPFKALGAVKDWLGDIGRTGGAKHFELEKRLGGGLFDPWANRLLGRSLLGAPGVMRELWGWLSGRTAASAPTLERATPALPDLPQGTGPDAWVKGSLRPADAKGNWTWLPPAGQPHLEIKPEVHVEVFVDGDRIESKLRSRVLRENMRHRRGYGDNALGYGVP